MSFTPQDLPDLRDRTVVITGANSGLGLESARLLAGAGATVVMTARSQEKFDKAAAEILPANRRADLRYVELDLADLSSVHVAAKTIAADHPVIDVLMNNAGVMMTPERTTADGLELQIGTNHFGHFALTGLLLDNVLAADAGRVVTVPSFMHHRGEVVLEDLHFRNRPYNPTTAYTQSKLANVLFFLELQRRLDAAALGAISVGAHPGYTSTNLQSAGVQMEGSGLFGTIADHGMRIVSPLIGMDAAEGALPQVYASVGAVDGGSYWGPKGPFGTMEVRGPVGRARISRKGRDEEKARRLWAISVETTGIAYPQLSPDQG